MSLLAWVGLSGVVLWLFLLWRGWAHKNTNKAPGNSSARTGLNRQQYEEAISALKLAKARNELDDSAYQSELARTQKLFIRASEADQTQDWSSTIHGPARAALIVLPLSITVLSFFATGGGTHWQEQGLTGQQAGGNAPDIDAMVAKLAARLESNPGDLTGWTMLGRSYMVLQRFPEAISAFSKANALSPEPNADLIVAEAEARGLANDQSLLGRPEEMIHQALVLDPTNIRGLWFAALAAQMRDAEEEAFAYLHRLAALPDLPPELQQTLVEIGVIQQLNAEGGENANAPAAADYALRINIALSDELRAAAPPGSQLMVFAKAANGPPMPVAAQRLDVDQFPLSVQLDDSHRVMSSHRISQQTELIVTARISSAGGAQSSSGDWEGQRRWTNQPNGGEITLTIDTVVP